MGTCYGYVLLALSAVSVCMIVCLGMAFVSNKRLGQRQEQRLVALKSCRIGIYALMSLGQGLLIGLKLGLHGLPSGGGEDLMERAMEFMSSGALGFLPWILTLVRAPAAYHACDVHNTISLGRGVTG